MIDVQALLAALPARIHAIPRAAAARTPEAPALREGTADDGRTLSYAALVGKIDRYAALLRGRGVRPGDRVLLVSENCSAQVALIFAASTVGAWVVNLNPRLSAPEIDAIQLHCGARLALYTAALSPEAAAHAARAGARADGALMIGPLNDACVPEAIGGDQAAGDPAAGDLADGEAGELWVRGPNVMRGYYREPLLTAAALRPGGWLNSGDMARRDDDGKGDGALFIVGLTRELIIRSGFKVFPLEVETVLNAYPGVTQSAVVGKAAADGNEEVVAFVQPDPHHAPMVDALRAWAAERLAPYKRPGRIVLMKALPAAATGKVLKHALKEIAATLA